MLKIKNISLPYLLAAAPFSGISNIPFRLLARKFGATLVFTEMISTRPFLLNSRQSAKLTAFKAEERPIFLQIATGRPWEAYHATEKAVALGFDGVDLNCGCPSRKIIRSKAGSYLLKDLPLAKKIIEAMRKALDDCNSEAVLSAKIRTGFRKSQINAVEFSKMLEDAGIDAIAIHARLTEQAHKGEPDFATVRKIKDALKIPVIYNGGIFSAEKAKLALEATEADGIMVGQGAFGKPWLFQEIAHFLETGEIRSFELDPAKIKEIMIWHYDELAKQFDEHIATLMFRRFAAWYIRNFEGASVFRKKFQKISSRSELVELTNEAFEHFAQ